MIQINRQQVQKSLRASSSHGVTCVVRVSPGISARCQAPVSQQVKHALPSQTDTHQAQTNHSREQLRQCNTKCKLANYHYVRPTQRGHEGVQVMLNNNSLPSPSFPPTPLGSLGEHCKLLQQVWAEPGCQTLSCAFSA